MGHELDSTLASFGKIGAVGAIDAAEIPSATRYSEGAELGKGGMGRVLLAHDARIGRDVALKVLHAERELEPQERARFLREAQVQGQLEHPSIVPVYDIDRREDGTTFFTMRRVLGRTLASIIEDLRQGIASSVARYTQRELLTAFATVCLTVDYAHTRGVVHRDLKPANIMLGDFGEVYVLDWGLARLVDERGASKDEPQERLSMPGSFLGTPMYMAPEQMADPDVGPAADVFALGLILFEILTLEHGRDPGALFAPIDARTSVRAPYRNVAPELETICVRATAFETQDRYPSARALQEAINRFLEGDRELEQRRQLAAKHMAAARSALQSDDDTQRGTAITELGRAVALDPNNAENFETLANLMSTPPKRVPAEVKKELEGDLQGLVKLGARHSLGAMMSWWLALPFLAWIGIADMRQLAWCAVPVVLTIAANVVMLKQRYTNAMTQYASIVLLMLASMSVSRFYGPFIIVPTLITTNVIVLQAHPQRSIRRFGVWSGTIAIVVAIAAEYLGVLPRSYVIADGHWSIVPQFVELPRDPTLVFLTVITVGSIGVPAAFIAKLRTQLNEAQVRLAVQAWHFRQLGSHLIGRPQ